MAREEQLTMALGTLTRALTDDDSDNFDTIEFLQTLTEQCASLLALPAAGISLLDPHGQPQLLAVTPRDPAIVDVLQSAEFDDITATVIQQHQLAQHIGGRAEPGRWLLRSAAASAAGLVSTEIVPMVLGQRVVGTLSLLAPSQTPLEPIDRQIAQGLLEVGAIGLLHARARREPHLLVEQLGVALSERDQIEQAKGLLAERRSLDIEEAFTAIRAQAARSGTRLAAVARALLDHTLDANDIDT